MSPIYLYNNKILLQNGKIAIDQKCCCNQCCIPWYGACCPYVKWTLTLSDCVPTEQRERIIINPIGLDEVNGITLSIIDLTCDSCGSGSCKIFARTFMKCNGFYACGDCNTDCTLTTIEYCLDPTVPNPVWSNNPTIACDCANIFESLTVEIYCDYSYYEQPPADSGLPPRGSLIVSGLTPEQCEYRGGTVCDSNPCENCGLVCGSAVPTEWRIVNTSNEVWFQGDIDYTDSPNRCPIGSGSNIVYMLDFPLMPPPGCANYSFCTEKCISYPEPNPQFPDLKLQLFDNGVWANAKKENGQDVGIYVNIACIQTEYGIEVVPVIVPKEWRCLTGPNGPVGCDDPSSEYYPCIECESIDIGVVCGNGLSYLGHGVGVKFTNRVDTNGGNAWNWEDADGNFPAGSLPGNLGGSCGPNENLSITIQGTLDRWLALNGQTFQTYSLSDASFDVVTLVPGSTLACSLTANVLLVPDQPGQPHTTIEANNGCNDPVTVTVTGNATLHNTINNAIIEGDVTLNKSSINKGTIDGNATFNTGSNNGEFNQNNGIVTGNAEFNDNSINYGTVEGNAVFNDYSANEAFSTIKGNAEFNDNSMNFGNIEGSAEFNTEYPLNTGLIEGNATFTRSSYTIRIHPTESPIVTPYVGNVNGTITFTSSSPVSFTTLDGITWTYDTSNWIFITNGQNWTFNNSTNQGILKGNTILNGFSTNWGGSTIDGNATFNNTSENAGHVTGIATFNDSACNELGSGTATTFVPDPPPSC